MKIEYTLVNNFFFFTTIQKFLFSILPTTCIDLIYS